MYRFLLSKTSILRESRKLYYGFEKNTQALQFSEARGKDEVQIAF